MRPIDMHTRHLKLCLAALHPAIVGDDAVQPSRKFRFAIELMQFAINVDKRILPRLFRFFFIAADFEGETIDKILVLFHKLCECTIIPCLRFFNKRQFFGGEDVLGRFHYSPAVPIDVFIFSMNRFI